METVARNAGEALTQHKLRRAGDLTARSQALEEIADGLGLDDRAAADRVLRRVADPGHRRGGEHGGLRGRAGPQERVPPVHRHRRHRRRLGHLRGAAPPVRPVPGRPATPASSPTTSKPAIDPETGRARKFAYAPQPGRRRRRRAAGQRGRGGAGASWASPTSRCAGLAKRLEEVWQPDEAFPVILPRTSEGLYLLQRVRDEAHRFAITFHRRAAVEADDGVRPRRRPGAGRDAAQGAAARVRLAEAARRRGQRRGDRRGAGHRSPHGRGHRRRPRPGRDRAGADSDRQARTMPDRSRRRSRRDGSATPATRAGSRAGDARRVCATSSAVRGGSVDGSRVGVHGHVRRVGDARRARTRSSSSSPGSPAVVAARSRGRWRTSASTSSTTCRRR